MPPPVAGWEATGFLFVLFATGIIGDRETSTLWTIESAQRPSHGCGGRSCKSIRWPNLVTLVRR